MAFSSSRVQMVFFGGGTCVLRSVGCAWPRSFVFLGMEKRSEWTAERLRLRVDQFFFFFVMVIFLWWALFYPTKVRGGKVYWQMWQHQSFVCLFWPEIARVESWSRGMMVYCFFAAFVHGRVDTWRQLQLFTYLGEWSASTSRSGLIFVLGGREDNKSTYPWIPIRTFLNAAKVFFCLPLCIDVGTLKRRETWPMCITSRNSDLATACRVQPY